MDKLRGIGTSEIGFQNNFLLPNGIHQQHIFKSTSYLSPRDIFSEIATNVNKTSLTILTLFHFFQLFHLSSIKFLAFYSTA